MERQIVGLLARSVRTTKSRAAAPRRAGTARAPAARMPRRHRDGRASSMGSHHWVPPAQDKPPRWRRAIRGHRPPPLGIPRWGRFTADAVQRRAGLDGFLTPWQVRWNAVRPPSRGPAERQARRARGEAGAGRRRACVAVARRHAAGSGRQVFVVGSSNTSLRRAAVARARVAVARAAGGPVGEYGLQRPVTSRSTPTARRRTRCRRSGPSQPTRAVGRRARDGARAAEARRLAQAAQAGAEPEYSLRVAREVVRHARGRRPRARRLQASEPNMDDDREDRADPRGDQRDDEAPRVSDVAAIISRGRRARAAERVRVSPPARARRRRRPRRTAAPTISRERRIVRARGAAARAAARRGRRSRSECRPRGMARPAPPALAAAAGVRPGRAPTRPTSRLGPTRRRRPSPLPRPRVRRAGRRSRSASGPALPPPPTPSRPRWPAPDAPPALRHPSRRRRRGCRACRRPRPCPPARVRTQWVGARRVGTRRDEVAPARDRSVMSAVVARAKASEISRASGAVGRGSISAPWRSSMFFAWLHGEARGGRAVGSCCCNLATQLSARAPAASSSSRLCPRRGSSRPRRTPSAFTSGVEDAPAVPLDAVTDCSATYG